MRAGDLVRFREHDNEMGFRIGLLLRYDPFTKVAEILLEDHLYYAPARLVEIHQRGQK